MISVKITNLDQVCEKLDSISEVKILEKGVGKAVDHVQEIAKLGAHVNTGELREKIFADTETKGLEVKGIVYTNVPQAIYQEFGTGPEGAANHAGISPEANPAYTLQPWWVHESQVLPSDAEMYHWPYIDTEDGRFYYIDGQEADPFLYPALKNHEEDVIEIIVKELRNAMR